MRNAGGFGSGGPGGFGGPPDFGAMAQQYWSALTDAMRAAGGGAPAQGTPRAPRGPRGPKAGGGGRHQAPGGVGPV